MKRIKGVGMDIPKVVGAWLDSDGVLWRHEAEYITRDESGLPRVHPILSTSLFRDDVLVSRMSWLQNP